MEKIFVTGILKEKREIKIENEKEKTKEKEVIKGWNLVLYWEVLNKKNEIVPFFRKVAAFGDYFHELGKELNIGDVITAIGSTKISKYKNEKAKKIIPTLEVIANDIFKVADEDLINKTLNDSDTEDETDYE